MFQRATALPLLLLWSVAVATPSTASASECGGVTTWGACLDSKTLVWCEQGQLKTLSCPSGEVCTDHERFGGGFGCIATQYTDCGAVTESGECVQDDRVLVFCEAQRVSIRLCDPDTTCAWVEEEGWYDCVPGAVATPRPGEPGEPGEPDEPVDPPDVEAPFEAPGGGPVPAVEKGGAGPAGTYVAGGGGGTGCAAGGPTPPWWLALGLLVPVTLRRRGPT